MDYITTEQAEDALADLVDPDETYRARKLVHAENTLRLFIEQVALERGTGLR